MSTSYHQAISDDFDPPISIPNIFKYSIRDQPTCIPFDAPETKYPTTASVGHVIPKSAKTKTNRRVYKWISENNITPEFHEHILWSGQSLEEFAIDSLEAAYKKRDLNNKKSVLLK